MNNHKSRGNSDGLPEKYYATAHLLRILRQLDEVVRKKDPDLKYVDFNSAVFDYSMKKDVLDLIEAEVKPVCFRTSKDSVSWQLSNRSKLYEVKWLGLEPFSRLRRRCLTSKDEPYRFLDQVLGYYLVNPHAEWADKWVSKKVSSGERVRVLRLDSDKFRGAVEYQFRYQGVLHYVGAIGKVPPSRLTTRRRVGSTVGLKKTHTASVNVERQDSSLAPMTEASKQALIDRELKRLGPILAKEVRGPEIPSGPEF